MRGAEHHILPTRKLQNYFERAFTAEVDDDDDDDEGGGGGGGGGGGSADDSEARRKQFMLRGRAPTMFGFTDVLREAAEREQRPAAPSSSFFGGAKSGGFFSGFGNFFKAALTPRGGSPVNAGSPTSSTAGTPRRDLEANVRV